VPRRPTVAAKFTPLILDPHCIMHKHTSRCVFPHVPLCNSLCTAHCDEQPAEHPSSRVTDAHAGEDGQGAGRLPADRHPGGQHPAVLPPRRHRGRVRGASTYNTFQRNRFERTITTWLLRCTLRLSCCCLFAAVFNPPTHTQGITNCMGDLAFKTTTAGAGGGGQVPGQRLHGHGVHGTRPEAAHGGHAAPLHRGRGAGCGVCYKMHLC
jgi:hypothetical protein